MRIDVGTKQLILFEDMTRPNNDSRRWKVGVN